MPSGAAAETLHCFINNHETPHLTAGQAPLLEDTKTLLAMMYHSLKEK
jgi:hypothetical protein